MWYRQKKKKKKEPSTILWFCSRHNVLLRQLRTSKFRCTPCLPFLFSTSSAPPSLPICTFPLLCSLHHRKHDTKAPVVKISTVLPASDKCQLWWVKQALCLCHCVWVCVCVHRALVTTAILSWFQRQVMIGDNNAELWWVDVFAFI